MATPQQIIAETLSKYGEQNNTDTVWKVQGTPVIYHKALERIAVRAGISFDTPVIVRAERDEAVILVTGRLGEHSDWSIGEALIGANYRVSGKQAAYVYAMAEKRAKDRVILKLIGLHGIVYSEAEADEFKRGGRDQDQGDEPDSKALFLESCRAHIRQAIDAAALGAWWQSDAQRKQRDSFDLSQAEIEALKGEVMARRSAITGLRGAA